jgi:glycosyltransferase involved in cell wall biosynthesis
MTGSLPVVELAVMPKARRSLLFLIPSLGGGGAERVILTILRHLDRERFDLTLAVIDGRPSTFRSDLADDVEYIDLKRTRVRYALPALVRLIWQRRPDIVLSTVSHLNLSLALLRPLLPRGTRLIARETSVLERALRDNPIDRTYRNAYRRLYRRFDQVVCQSDAMRHELIDAFAVPADRARVIRNPIDSVRIRSLASKPLPESARLLRQAERYPIRLVAAGRLVEEKGFDTLIEAVALLDDASVCLTILGEGKCHQDLENLIEKHGLEDRVQLMGFQSNPYPFFANASAFVLSSRYESFPNVVLEALACGTPVIASPAEGGTLEILKGRRDCVIADDLSAPSLARAISGFAYRAGREPPSMSEYEAERVAGQYAALFE